MNTKTKIISIIVAVAIMAGIGFSVYRSRQTPEIRVSAHMMDSGEVSSVLLSTGKITSAQEKSYAGPNLAVKTVEVKIGDRVEKDQVLLTFDTSDVEMAIKQAKLQRENAALNRDAAIESVKAAETAQANLKKQVQTLEANLHVSKERQEEALKDPLDIANIAIIAEETQKIAAYQAGLSQIQQNLGSLPSVSDSQIKLLDNTVAAADLAVQSAEQRAANMVSEIKADFAGIITEVNAQENQIATVNINVLTLKNDDNLNVTLKLGKFDAAKVKLGQQTKVIYGDRDFKGEVSFISPAASSGSPSIGGLGSVSTGGESTLNVEVSIFEPKEIIMDFDAEVEILLEKKAKVLRIPVESLLYDSSTAPYVYVINQGIITKTKVVLGLISDTYMECIEGLNEGDQIVLNPSDSLKDQDQVTVND